MCGRVRVLERRGVARAQALDWNPALLQAIKSRTLMASVFFGDRLNRQAYWSAKPSSNFCGMAYRRLQVNLMQPALSACQEAVICPLVLSL